MLCKLWRHARDIHMFSEWYQGMLLHSENSQIDVGKRFSSAWSGYQTGWLHRLIGRDTKIETLSQMMQKKLRFLKTLFLLLYVTGLTSCAFWEGHCVLILYYHTAGQPAFLNCSRTCLLKFEHTIFMKLYTPQCMQIPEGLIVGPAPTSTQHGLDALCIIQLSS